MFKIGDKAKGFKFDSNNEDDVSYVPEMDRYVGVLGEVDFVSSEYLVIQFEKDSWAYPMSLAHLAVVEEKATFNVGDKGNSFNVGDKVKFKKSSLDSGMIDASEEDVFEIMSVFGDNVQVFTGEFLERFNQNHFEHVKEETMNTNEQQIINWEVGQEVFCLLRGKGVVHQIYNTGVDWSEGVDVYFVNHGVIRFKFDGTFGIGFNRSLFFSEPRIEAEKFPPKKPFVPKLKRGDVILVKVKDELYGEGTVKTVYGEIDDRIYISENHHYFLKKDILSIRTLSEEIIFN